MLAAEEINAEGGFLGKRKIETITADESAGTDANVKELRRMKLSEKIDLFTGVISSGNTPALGPVAEELGVLTMFIDGCTDFLFDKAVPKPKYVFRMTNIQSADGVTSAVGAAKAWPEVKRIASHPAGLQLWPQRASSISCSPTRSSCPARQPFRRLAEARHHRLHRPHHQADSDKPDLLICVGVGRRLRGDVQAGLALRPVREDEGCDHAGFRRDSRTQSARITPRACSRAATPTTSSPSRRETVADQQLVRRKYYQALERISELPGGRRLSPRSIC